MNTKNNLKGSLKSKLPIAEIIKNRVSMQSTQKKLEKIGITEFAKITSGTFYNEYKSWNNYKKNQFLEIIAGKVHFGKAFQYFEKIGQ